MKKDVQHIRRSQFVLTYGPGAIIESRNGPRIIPSINHGLYRRSFSLDKFQEFEITDSRLRIAIKNLTGFDARVFSLPSNASLKELGSRGIYPTYIFPTWRVCYGRKGKHRSILYNGTECPICHKDDDSSAVRFVTACINGHLDEVPWNYAVHQGKNCDHGYKPQYFYWESSGSSLSDIVIECPDCGCKTDMGRIYRLDFECTGRFPEKERPSDTGRGAPFYTQPERPFKDKCDAKMKVTQRQSSSLRIPETLTLLTIPEYDNAISNILQRPVVSAAVDMLLRSSSARNGKMSAEELISNIKSSTYITDEAALKIEEYIREKGIPSFCDLFNRLHSEEKTFMDFIYEEFESLLAGARTTDNYSMSPPKKVSSSGGGILPDLDIYPINKIRTITAQRGYRRMPYTAKSEEPEKIVPYEVYLGDSYWYPGFEGLGEGIFITFSENMPSPDFDEIKAYKEWKNHKRSGSGGNPLWRDVSQKPLFVWLHTLSHSIIRALSQYAGYSSASLRERVYIDRDAKNGGILIYTTSPGEDGSMGGLVGAADEFNDILEIGLESIKVCSNDPLCSEVRKTPDRFNGAACYSCLLISETSCEHRNMWLDRHIILRD